MIEIQTLDKPDERRDFPRGHLEALHMTGLDFAVATFEPGWHWAESVGPIAGTASCQFEHKCVMLSGRLRIRMDDGAEMEAGPGDVFVVSPGHDAWVVGDEAAVAYDFAGPTARTYAKAEEG